MPLTMVQEVALPIPSRQWLTDHLTREHGLTPALSAWLASSLAPATGPPQQAGQQQQGHGHDRAHGAHGHPHGGHAQHGGLAWTFDAPGAHDLYRSYCSTDLWRACEQPPAGAEVHLVRALKSDRWYPQMLSALERTAQAHAGLAARMHAGAQVSAPGSAASGGAGGAGGGGGIGRFLHHELPNAGHWLHVDNPTGLLQIMLPRLTQAAAQA